MAAVQVNGKLSESRLMLLNGKLSKSGLLLVNDKAACQWQVKGMATCQWLFVQAASQWQAVQGKVTCPSRGYLSRVSCPRHGKLSKVWLLVSSLLVASHPKALPEDVSELIQEETRSFKGVQTRSRKPKSLIVIASRSASEAGR